MSDSPEVTMEKLCAIYMRYRSGYVMDVVYPVDEKDETTTGSTVDKKKKKDENDETATGSTVDKKKKDEKNETDAGSTVDKKKKKDEKDETTTGSTVDKKKKDEKDETATGSTVDKKKDENDETATGSSPDDMLSIINGDVKVVEHFLKMIKEKKNAMKIGSRSEKVNRDEMISVNLVYGDSIKIWRTNLGSKATVKALITAIIQEHGVPESKQEIHINGEGNDVAMMDRKSVLFNLMVRNNTNIVITRKPCEKGKQQEVLNRQQC